MRVLVAGAGGFFGRHLLRALATAGHEATALVRSHSRRASLADTIVADTPAAVRALRLDELGIDAIINTAAAGVDPADRSLPSLVDTNVALPVALVELAAKFDVKAIVHIGSSAEYAELQDGQLAVESSSLDSRRVYGATKAAGSLAFLAAAAHCGVSAAVLRPFNLFGEGEAAHRLFASLVRRLDRGEQVPLSPGTQLRDFISVRDASRAVVLMIEALAGNKSIAGAYNVSTGRALSVADFARTVARAMQAPAGLLKFGEIPMRADDLKWVVGSPEKLHEAIGWRANEDTAVEIADACSAQRKLMGAYLG